MNSAELASESAAVSARSAAAAKGRVSVWLDRLLRAVELIDGFVLALDVAMVFLSVICRYFLHDPLDWVEEIASSLMTILIFAGSATQLARRKHVGLIEVVSHLFPQGWRPILDHICAWVTVAVSIGVLVSGILLWDDSIGQTTPLGFSKNIYFYPLIIGSVLMVLFSVAGALSGPRRLVGWSAFSVGLAAIALYAAITFLPEDSIPPMVMLLGGFFVTVIIGVPISFSLGFASLLYFVSDPDMPTLVYSQQMISGGSNFVLLAIPFFILAGLAMEVNGMSSRLIELLVRLLGRMRGGLNVIMIVATALFSGISGSKLADIAAVGSILMPAVRRTKQNPNEAAGLLACTAVMAETIPPCINIIIFGFVSNVSIGGLFLAGLVPAGVLAVALISAAIVFGTKVDPRTAFEQRRAMLPLLGGAAVALLMVLMIGRGVTSGIATSTEVSAFAVVYAIVVGGLSFRELTWSKVVRLFVQAASMTGGIMFIMSAASAVSFTLTVQQIPQQLSTTLVALGQEHGSTAFLVISVAVMVVFGAVLEGAPALVIFGPLLTPIAMQLGISAYHFGVISVISMGLGLFAPPVGLGLFATCAITETDMRGVVRPMSKYLLVLVVGLLALVFIPKISLWLPMHYGFQ